MYKFKKRYIKAIIIFFLLLATGVILKSAGIKNSEEKITPKFTQAPSLEEIQARDKDVYGYLNRNLESLMELHDVNGVMEIAMEAFKTGEFDAFECHTFIHEVGHHAASSWHFDHIEGHVISANVNFCGGGFIHGVEDGLASFADENYREKLHYFCTLISPISTTYKGCYHGAGHAFMKRFEDPKMAISECETLINNKEIPLTHCYRGVFSEYMEGLIRDGANHFALLDFCEAQDAAMHSVCSREINGFGLKPSSTKEDVELAFQSCIEGNHNEIIKEGCINSVSWVAVDNALAQKYDITPLPFMLALPARLRQAYISGITSEITRHKRDGREIEWDTFCSGFIDKNDQKICREGTS